MASSRSDPRVFIIHAGEDKDWFVRPLFITLRQQGLAEKDIFFDDVSLKPGEAIRDRIISTLSSEALELAVIVVSKSFLNKPYWPKLEFETCVKNNKRVFPIWVDANNDNFEAFSVLVGKYSPTLKQLSAKCLQRDDVTDELPNIADEIIRRLQILPSSSELSKVDVEIDCSACINHDSIASFLRDYHDLMTETRRKLLQRAMAQVTDESRTPSWVWKDAQITVHGPLMKVVFFSGDRDNKFVVFLENEEFPVVKPEEKGWPLLIHDGCMAARGWVVPLATLAGLRLFYR
ncbi:uncharacterized protein [Branchiostoma lanceolatum]|uniref:uncharacterized protein n=1 Tax=Branchiostoma lanceolatum TaxID=7740 RepID=UPI003452769E